MSLTAIVILIIIPVTQGWNRWGVSHTETHLCVLKGSTVNISCTYRYPSGVTVQEKFWFIKDSNDVYVDLRSDPEYSDRVSYNCDDNKCSLRITDLRVSDSAVYRFRFITNGHNGGFTGKQGVSLTVTDLQVIRSRSYLTCGSSCRLSGKPNYIWIKNGEEIQGNSLYYVRFDNDGDSYSCGVKGQENSRSLVYVNDWGVTYTSTDVCALNGSTVTISCTYKYPTGVTIQERFWSIRDSNGSYVDLRSDPEYSSRVTYKCGGNKCSLRITDLRESDSAVYKFRLNGEQTGGFTGEPGVSLGVTMSDPRLQVQVRRSAVNQDLKWTELTCHAECQLTQKPSYIWYNDGEKVEERQTKSYFLTHLIRPTDSYSCAVSGYESFPSAAVCLPGLPETWKLAAIIGATLALVLAFIGLSAFFLIRNTRATKKQEPGHEPGDGREGRPNESEEDELPYASIHFSQNRPEHASSKIQTAGHHRHREEVEEAGVEYSFVKFNSATPAPSTEDTSALYSTVNSQ